MKTRISAGLVALVVLLLAIAAVASASSTNGKLTAFSYDSSTKVGHITVTAKHKTKYKFTSKTNCGVSQGQSGNQVPCKSLGKSKYHNKPVSVTWTKNANGTRVASLIAVHL
ncbi:MAG: hypothetical protein QOC77_2825 [Thermoleophilaceae bacterium]|jgi:YD repeat-containing protein|nr:hypothetical protein [Thermoleophilaceae bacterium]MEA2469885.1 hypothetical protein [Thermoleophilaceae bacterium]